MTDLPSGTVTFLFTDIERSTKLLKELGAPRYGDVLSAHNRLVRAAFTEAGGIETHHQGDSFVAVFVSAGAAVRAAVAAQHALDDEPWPHGIELRVRMGIHTGEARLDKDGYVGMAVHDAARVGDVGHGGQVLLSETATRLVQDHLPDGVRLQRLGGVQLEEERMEVLHQLEIEGLPFTFPPPAKRGEEAAVEPLLEREAELTILRAICEAGAAGSGRVVVVEGPPGIGKSSLVAAARELATSAGMSALAARAGEFERDFSYGVLRQLFEPALATASREERAELLSGAAELTGSLFDLSHPEVVGEEAEEVPFAMLHGLFWLAANLASQQPLALAIDDLHWCDPPSLRFLSYLVRRMEGLPLVVVASLRPGQADVDEALMAEITGDPLTVVVRPNELSTDSVVVFLRARLGGHADEEFCAAAHAAVGGNPLLLRELATRLVTDGVAPVAANARRVEQLGPRAVARAILMRLARLPDDARRLARAAAIVGDEADLSLAADLAALDERRAARASAALVRADILSQRDPIAFAHPVVRAAVHEEILPVERGELHRSAAELLVAAGAVPERIAVHLLMAAPADDPFVVEHLRVAASRSLARGAADAAVSYLRRALAEPPIAAERGAVLRELGLAERLVDTDAAITHLGEAVDALSDPIRRAETALAYGRQLVRSNRHQDGVAAFDRALRELGSRNPELAECLHAELIGAASFEAHLRSVAVRELEKVDERSFRGGHGTDLLQATLGYHLMRAGVERERAIALLRGSLASGSLDREAARAFFYATYSLVLAGEVDEAVRAYDASLDAARRRGDVLTASAVLLFRGMTSYRSGDLTSAEEDLRESVDMGGFATAAVYQTAVLAELQIEKGELEEAERVIELANLPDQVPANLHLAYYLDARGRVRFAAGRPDEALRDLRMLARHLDAVGVRNPAYVPWRGHAAEVLVALGEREEAYALAREELELAQEWGEARTIGIALRSVGLAADDDEAIEALREAVAVLDGVPARLEHARALVDLGIVLHRAGDRSEARSVLRRGQELAELAAATRLSDQARSALTSTGVRPLPVIPSGVESLTTSERRVAEMAREGLTNRQIAEALFVTPKTVEVHLSSVYRKLGITSRSQLDDGLTAEPAETGAPT
jgi:class 3 adenylate cyclase/DNA-binding CsgD family transcriptional regulator